MTDIKQILKYLGIGTVLAVAIGGAVYIENKDGNDKKMAFVVFENVRMTRDGKVVKNDMFDKLDNWIITDGSSTNSEIETVYTEYKKLSKKDIYSNTEQDLREAAFNAKLYEIRSKCKQETKRCREVKVKD